MELKEGMYIRTKDKNGIQYIRKVVDLPKDTRYGSIIVDKYIHNVKWVSKKNVLKASYEKMDLIKPGDYVNGYKVIEIIKNFKVRVDKLELNTSDGNYYLKSFTNHQIKSIVTKEVFKANEYRVEAN